MPLLGLGYLALLGSLLAFLAASTARLLWLKIAVFTLPAEQPGTIGLYIASAENVFHNVSATGFDKGVVLGSGARGNAFSGLQLERGPVRHGYVEPLKWAHDYLVERAGLATKGDHRIWDALRSAARAGEITIWGRPGGNGLNPDHFYKPPEPIDALHWRHFGFDELRCLYHEDERACRTEPDSGRSGFHYDETYADLRIKPAEIEARWPVPA